MALAMGLVRAGLKPCGTRAGFLCKGMVEAAGIEPASQCTSVKVSTCLVYLFKKSRRTADPGRQGSATASLIIFSPSLLR